MSHFMFGFCEANLVSLPSINCLLGYRIGSVRDKNGGLRTGNSILPC